MKPHGKPGEKKAPAWVEGDRAVHRCAPGQSTSVPLMTALIISRGIKGEGGGLRAFDPLDQARWRGSLSLEMHDKDEAHNAGPVKNKAGGACAGI